MIDFDWDIMTKWSKEEVRYTYLEKMIGSIMCTTYCSLAAKRYFSDTAF